MKWQIRLITSLIENLGTLGTPVCFFFNEKCMFWFSRNFIASTLIFSANIKDGNRPSETATEDMFIRKFMWGTWPNLFASEVIIKRQHNIIRIAGIITRTLTPYKIYFLIGYTEELLSYWLQCPIKVELVTIDNKKQMIFKYI